MWCTYNFYLTFTIIDINIQKNKKEHFLNQKIKKNLYLIKNKVREEEKEKEEEEKLYKLIDRYNACK